MPLKLGPSSGNSGALIRWGKNLGHGVWLRTWNLRKLWFRWRIRPSAGLYDFGIVLIH